MEHPVTDLERIRRDLVACRDIPWSCSCVEPEQLAALVEEVERLRGERAAVVAYLRKQANAPHPIERGVPSLSPAGRGLLLFHADRFERGEHRREEGT
jgi:hypothetical protein